EQGGEPDRLEDRAHELLVDVGEEPDVEARRPYPFHRGNRVRIYAALLDVERVVGPLEPPAVRLGGLAAVLPKVRDEVPPEMIADRDPLLRLARVVRAEVFQEPVERLLPRLTDPI